jgi:hypothetical protein
MTVAAGRGTTGVFTGSAVKGQPQHAADVAEAPLSIGRGFTAQQPPQGGDGPGGVEIVVERGKAMGGELLGALV